MKKSFERLLVFFTILGCCWSSVSFITPFNSFTDLSQSLGIYFLSGHVLSLTLLLLFTPAGIRLLLSLLLWNSLLILRYSVITFAWYFPPETPPVCNMEQAAPVSVLFANVYSGNDNYEALMQQIEAMDPD